RRQAGHLGLIYCVKRFPDASPARIIATLVLCSRRLAGVNNGIPSAGAVSRAATGVRAAVLAAPNEGRSRRHLGRSLKVSDRHSERMSVAVVSCPRIQLFDFARRTTHKAHDVFELRAPDKLVARSLSS